MRLVKCTDSMKSGQRARRVVRVPDDAFRSVHVIHHFFALRDVGIRLGG